MKTAKFIPVAGYLLCPNCNEKITANDGKTTTIQEHTSQWWEAMSKEKWQCGKCHRHFSLPVNPFKNTVEDR